MLYTLDGSILQISRCQQLPPRTIQTKGRDRVTDPGGYIGELNYNSGYIFVCFLLNILLLMSYLIYAVLKNDKTFCFKQERVCSGRAEGPARWLL